MAKFTAGAWVMTLLVPLLLVTFGAVRRHYDTLAVEIARTQPQDVANIQPPIVIVPMRDWNKMSQKGLRFALTLSPSVSLGTSPAEPRTSALRTSTSAGFSPNVERFTS